MNVVKNKIKPCPKCGDAWLHYVDGECAEHDARWFRVNCKCGFAWIMTPFCLMRQEAISKWNEKVMAMTKKDKMTSRNKDFYDDLPGTVCAGLEILIDKYGNRPWFNKAWEEYRNHVKSSSLDDMRMPGYIFKHYIEEEKR